MNMDPKQFEEQLGDSLERICASAPPAPQADAIFARLRRRKRRRAIETTTAVVVLVGCISTLVFFHVHQPSSTETTMVPVPLIRIDPSAKAGGKPSQPWRIPTMKLTAISSPSLKVQDGLPAEFPASSVTAGTEGTSPNMPLRFVAPRVSLPKL